MIQAKTSWMSLLVGLASGGCCLAVLHYFGAMESFVQEVVVFFSVLVCMTVLTAFLFRWYTKKNIAPIYKTIYSKKLSEPELKQKFHNQHVLDRVNADVQRWVELKTTEIEHLKEAELYRKEFLGNVAHELNTPLFNIQGYVLTLLDGALEDPKINRAYLERTQKNVDRLINTVKDLDAITKLESKENLPQKDDFDLVELTQEVFDFLENSCKQKQVRLLMQQDYDPILVRADRKQISQVLMNLVGNAIAYGREAGTVTVAFSHTPNHILVEVIDNGIGIDKADIHRIFERFYRVDKHRSRQDGGTGLGLAIVKHILEAHDQRINVISTLGAGSTFAFTLNRVR